MNHNIFYPNFLTYGLGLLESPRVHQFLSANWTQAGGQGYSSLAFFFTGGYSSLAARATTTSPQVTPLVGRPSNRFVHLFTWFVCVPFFTNILNTYVQKNHLNFEKCSSHIWKMFMKCKTNVHTTIKNVRTIKNCLWHFKNVHPCQKVC